MAARRGAAYALALAALLLPSLAALADVQFEVSGRAHTTPGGLQVAASLRNIGDSTAHALRVRGELGSALADAVPGDVAPRALAAATFDFPQPERAGRHAVLLRLEFYPTPEAAKQKGSPAIQWGYLLIGLGADPPPALALEVSEARIETAGPLVVRLTSLDGFSHRASVSCRVPYGLGMLGEPPEVEIPAGGSIEVPLPLVRGSAVRGSRSGVLVVARLTDGGMERVAVATGVVEILPDPALLPRLRVPLALAGSALLGFSLWAEWRRRRTRVEQAVAERIAKGAV